MLDQVVHPLFDLLVYIWNFFHEPAIKSWNFIHQVLSGWITVKNSYWHLVVLHDKVMRRKNRCAFCVFSPILYFNRAWSDRGFLVKFRSLILSLVNHLLNLVWSLKLSWHLILGSFQAVKLWLQLHIFVFTQSFALSQFILKHFFVQLLEWLLGIFDCFNLDAYVLVWSILWDYFHLALVRSNTFFLWSEPIRTAYFLRFYWTIVFRWDGTL